MAYPHRIRVLRTDKHLLVGARFDQQGWGLDATVKEIAIWNRGVSDDEIAKLYDNGQGVSIR